MGKITLIRCDSCDEMVKGPYYTIEVQKHEKGAEAEKLGTAWLCDVCYNNLIRSMVVMPSIERETQWEK